MQKKKITASTVIRDPPSPYTTTLFCTLSLFISRPPRPCGMKMYYHPFLFAVHLHFLRGREADGASTLFYSFFPLLVACVAGGGRGKICPICATLKSFPSLLPSFPCPTFSDLPPPTMLGGGGSFTIKFKE